MTALLTVRALERKFRGLSVLRGVSFDVPAQGITGLIGPNGAGKSTLFNIVSGFLAPSAGSIGFDGSDISRWTVTQRVKHGIVRTFQTPQVFGHMTVGENLMAGGWLATRSTMFSAMLGLGSSRRDSARLEEMARAAAQRFELADIWDIRAADLPAGRQRLVELARASMTSPRLLCLDEPSSGLNAEEVRALRQSIDRLAADGIAILLVSHDMGLMEVASTVNVLCFGEIIASGPFAAVKESPKVREAYLGV